MRTGFAVALVVLLMLTGSVAHAQDTLPGDACTGGQTGYVRNNMAMSSYSTPYNLVTCNGSTWVGLVSGSTTGIQIPSSTALTGDISPASITANQNDYNPAGLATASVLRLSTDASRNITGLSGGADGRTLTILNVGSNPIVLKNQDAASTAASRFAIGADITLSADQSVSLIYDATSQRWRAGALPFDQGGGGGSSCIAGAGATSGEWAPYTGHWGDGTYFYVVNDDDEKLEAYAWTGATDGTYIAQAPGTTNSPYAVWGQGGFVFVGDGNNLRAYTFNGTAFTLAGTQNTTAAINQIWGNGTTLFVANNDYKIRAYTFNGTSFSAAGTANTGYRPQDIVGSGTYIVVAEFNDGSPDYNNQVEAFTYVGTTFTQQDTEVGLDGGFGKGIATDGTYFYLSGWGLAAYSFNGTTLTKLNEAENIAPAQGHTVTTSGSYIYFLGGDGIHVFTFDGSYFDLAGFYGLSSQYPQEIGVYGGYVFGTGTGTWINHQAYPECSG